MKRWIALVLVSLLFWTSVRVSASYTISAKAYVLIEAQTGRILAEKDAHMALPMASTTKIMTALLALEQPDVEERFTVDRDAIRTEGTSMGLKEGDEVSLYDLAGGMLTSSGNDAANAAAVRISGSYSAFADLMNARAAMIGMENTHFVTPSGLHDDAHVSTAYDMALLAKEALQNEDFAAICSAAEVTLFYGAPPYRRTLSNHNRLLKEYDGCIGVKTGYTKKAGRCLVSAAKRDGVTLICVTLNAPNDWQDHKNLLNYGFSVTQVRAALPQVHDIHIPTADGNSIGVEVLAPAMTTFSAEELANCRRVIECYPFLYETVKGDYVGDAVYYYGRVEVCRVALIADG